MHDAHTGSGSAGPKQVATGGDALLVACGQVHEPGRLDTPYVEGDQQPPVDSVVGAWTARQAAGRLVVTGGEPTLYGELPQLLRVLGASDQVTLATNGFFLARAEPIHILADHGLQRVRVGLHSARGEAHDWLLAVQGAARRAVRCLRLSRDAGMEIEVEIVLTQPTTDHLPETVELACRLGVRRIQVRRLTVRGPSAALTARLAPRLELLEEPLRRAESAAMAHEVEILFKGFPPCIAPRSARFVPLSRDRWIIPTHASLAGVSSQVSQPTGLRCADCPEAGCDGVPPEYAALVGTAGLRPPAPQTVSPAAGVWHTAFGAPSRVGCRACGGSDSEVEAGRAIRQRMVAAARRGARRVRIASSGSLAHPDAAALIGEVKHLPFDEVEVVAEASVLAEMSDADLAAIGAATRVTALLYGPDAARHDAHIKRPGAFDATLSGLRRLQQLGGARLGCCGVLVDVDAVPGYAAAWAQGVLPGEPSFRLAAHGGSLNELADRAAVLEDPVARSALARLLPSCLAQRVRGAAGQSQLSSGTGWLTAYEPCPVTASCESGRDCVGLPAGWHIPEAV